ncbi:hypothetical protein CEXT_671781 [Caerostris extrusa]|uniref:Secreted protein n=1 Tax=Caerostris extrusa TaxID=172846 RepID=A0AAV4XKK0_CAEEX|nr:hypothetical protein CEXT_671781 [Caerostris extrusa]
MCARWVPRALSDKHEAKRMMCNLTFLPAITLLTASTSSVTSYRERNLASPFRPTSKTKIWVETWITNDKEI